MGFKGMSLCMFFIQSEKMCAALSSLRVVALVKNAPSYFHVRRVLSPCMSNEEVELLAF